MKQTIRLTESELHNIIKESVMSILKEGQGWDKFKSVNKDIWSGKGDDENYPSYKEYKNYVNNENNRQYYDEDDGEYYSSGKKVNNGLTGKLGRAAGGAGLYASLAARRAYNKLRGKY